MLLLAACRTTPRQPVQTGVQPAATQDEGSRGSTPATGTGGGSPHVNQADVQFMQGMILHHAQAVRMAGLVAERTDNRAIHLIAERIDVSQRDEIKLMQRWLREHHAAVPHPPIEYSPHTADTGSAMHAMSGMSMGHGHGALMPGMLTPEQMAQLAASKGTTFDRLFLEGMIGHHGGALTMVAKLFATPGATQDPQIFEFATEIDAGQRAEIARMRTVLDAMPGGAPGR
jgi:uncharacterized protein (DUF305 family)